MPKWKVHVPWQKKEGTKTWLTAKLCGIDPAVSPAFKVTSTVHWRTQSSAPNLPVQKNPDILGERVLCFRSWPMPLPRAEFIWQHFSTHLFFFVFFFCFLYCMPCLVTRAACVSKGSVHPCYEVGKTLCPEKVICWHFKPAIYFHVCCLKSCRCQTFVVGTMSMFTGSLGAWISLPSSGIRLRLFLFQVKSEWWNHWSVNLAY